MKKTTFEMLLIGLSAPMAGIGMGMLMNGSIGGAFMLLGCIKKLVVAYFRTPKDLFDWDNFGGTFEDFKDRMEKIQNELDNEKPLLGWLSDLGNIHDVGWVICFVTGRMNRISKIFFKIA